MSKILKFIVLAVLLSVFSRVNAQDSAALIAEGNKYYEAKNYKDAIVKFEEVLRADSANLNARYKLAFSLNAVGEGNKALPHLQSVVRSNPPSNILSSSYGIMGGIYDKLRMPSKAIESYQKGIQADTLDHLLRYGLGLAYFRTHQYAKAEESAIEALKINPGHAASMRLYALVTFHQNKRAPALLGLCSFLYQDAKGPQATEAYTNMQSILKGGTLKTDPGVKAAQVLSAETRALNNAITSAIASLRIKSNASLLEQLKAVFLAVGKQSAERKGGSSFYANELAPLYYQLAQSSHLPAFVNYITQNNDRNAANWVAIHQQELKQLHDWMKSFKSRNGP